MSIRLLIKAGFWPWFLLVVFSPAMSQATYTTVVQTTADNWVGRDNPTQSNPTSSTL